MLGLPCCTWTFSNCGKWGLLSGCSEWASHCGDFSCLRGTGSVIEANSLTCPAACWIFLEQGSNLCPLHWQPDPQPLNHQGSLGMVFSISRRGNMDSSRQGTCVRLSAGRCMHTCLCLSVCVCLGGKLDVLPEPDSETGP